MASEYATTPRFQRLDARYGHIAELTGLRNARYRRALVLLEAAERHGGPDTEAFRAWLGCAAENWRAADPYIMRELAKVPASPDQNT